MAHVWYVLLPSCLLVSALSLSAFLLYWRKAEVLVGDDCQVGLRVVFYQEKSSPQETVSGRRHKCLNQRLVTHLMYVFDKISQNKVTRDDYMIAKVQCLQR